MTQQTSARATARNGLGIASLILGLLALLTSLALVGLLFGSFAITLGLSSWDLIGRKQATNRKTTIAGVVLGVVAVVISLVSLGFKLWWLF